MVDPLIEQAVLDVLLSRYSVGPKHLVPPAPTAEELELALKAALRGPDHKKLKPFRFVVVRENQFERLAELFVDYGRRHDKSEAELTSERQRAVQGADRLRSARAARARPGPRSITPL